MKVTIFIKIIIRDIIVSSWQEAIPERAIRDNNRVLKPWQYGTLSLKAITTQLHHWSEKTPVELIRVTVRATLPYFLSSKSDVPSASF